MRKIMLASTAAFGLALAVPALAQNAPTPPTGATTMPGQTGGMSGRSMPSGGSGQMMGEGPERFLHSAQQAVQHHRMAEAREALERAETRLLDRATTPDQASQPDTAPAIQSISQALAALGHRDWSAAGQHIDQALQNAQMAQSGSGTMGNAGMSTGGNGTMGNASMGNGGNGSMGNGGMGAAPAGTGGAAIGGNSGTMGSGTMNGVPAMGGTSQPTAPGMGGNTAPPAGNQGLAPNGVNGQSGSGNSQ